MSIEKGDKIAKSMAAGTLDWFDVEPAKLTANQCLKVVNNLIQSMLKDNFDDEKPKDKGQTGAYLIKMMDVLGRFIQFSQGQADSRKEVTVADLLPHLSSEELAIFDRALARLEQAADTGATTPFPKPTTLQ